MNNSKVQLNKRKDLNKWYTRIPRHFRTSAASTFRMMSSFAPAIGLMTPPSRPQGISAIVRVKDEEAWLAPSLRSISSAVDEIIVGDNGSTDSTPNILDALKKELGNQLTVLKRPEADIKDLTNNLIDQTRFRWILKWDADYVAKTDGPNPISNLREWLLNLDPKRYFLVYPTMIELCGDLFHQRTTTPTRADCNCFTFSPKLHYVYDRHGWEAPLVPIWYRVLKYDTPTFYHVDVKPTVRMFLSFLWKRYLGTPDRDRFRNFQDYVSQTRQKEWQDRTGEEMAELWALEHFRGLAPYDHDRFGDYPSLLKPFLKNSPYRCIPSAKVGQIGTES